ncbi:hypothetical protein SBA4_3560004 [Candidatus Sulfopaludibacter sp. SbA4]|nr:hypothetical protein SBA4_3560004 [Candidatus Sulfopaludibacter sp. SbA4]
MKALRLHHVDVPAESFIQVRNQSARKKCGGYSPASISKSKSLSSRASPRASDPNTLMSVTP